MTLCYRLRTLLLAVAIVPMLVGISWREGWVHCWYRHGDWLSIEGECPAWNAGASVGPYQLTFGGASSGLIYVELAEVLPPDPYYHKRFLFKRWRNKP